MCQVGRTWLVLLMAIHMHKNGIVNCKDVLASWPDLRLLSFLRH